MTGGPVLPELQAALTPQLPPDSVARFPALPPPPPGAPNAIPAKWWAGLVIAVLADLAFAVSSILYGNLLEVEAVLAAAEILLAVVAIFGIYVAVVHRVSAL